MKIIIQVIATAVMCFVLQYFFPWWTMAFGAAAAGYLAKNKSYVAFLAGCAGAGLLWMGVAIWSDAATHSILTEKINRLLPASALLLTTLVGGLVGGFSGLTGSLMRKLEN